MEALEVAEKLRLPVTVEQDEEGWYVAECPAIPGCLTQAKTLDDALESIREVIELCLEVRREKGLPLTIQTYDIEVPMYAQTARSFGKESGSGTPMRRLGSIPTPGQPHRDDQARLHLHPLDFGSPGTGAKPTPFPYSARQG